MALAIVQHASGHGTGSGTPGTMTLGSTPTVGNRIVIGLDINASYTVPTLNGNYRLIDKAGDNTTVQQILLTRIVQAGDTTTLPAPASGGSTFSAWTAFEISGGTGNDDSDLAFWWFAYQASGTSIAPVSRLGNVAGQLALAFFGKYNGTAVPSSVSSGWTADEMAVDNTNYGAYGCAHKALASVGDAADITVTFTSAGTLQSCIVLVLTPSPGPKPVIRHSTWKSASGIPGQIETFAAPKAHALQLVLIGWHDGTSAAPTPTADWTMVSLALNGSNPSALLFYRYPGSGESSNVPALCSAGSTFWGAVFAEIDGATGDPAQDIGYVTSGYQASGSTQTTTLQAAPTDHSLGILAAFNYDGAGALAITGGFSTLISQVLFSTFGSFVEAFKETALAGDTIQSTITENATTHTGSYIQLFIPGEFVTGAGSSSSGGTFTDSIVTQGGLTVLAEGGDVAQEAVVTQGGMISLASIAMTAFLTQGGIQVLGAVQPPMFVTSGGLLALAFQVPCATQWQQLWRITRKDGRVFRYTSLDEDFTWGTQVFKSCGSLNPSAAEDNIAIGDVANQEFAGLLTDDGITEDDLYGGMFDDAFVEVWQVAYSGTEIPKRMAAGWTGNVTHSKSGFKMEVVGPGARLGQQGLVQPYAPGCRWEFGSTQCGFDREAARVSGMVIGSTDRGMFLSDADEPSGGAFQWANGLVRWLSGQNEGLECEVKAVDFGTDGAAITLWELAGFRPQIGDTFYLLPGCDLTTSQCKLYGRFPNSFGGFPDVPGEDAVLATPDAKI